MYSLVRHLCFPILYLLSVQFTTQVTSCEPVHLVLTANGKKNKVNCFQVILKDTILFPEGGGQPDDRGTINSVEVIKVERKGASAVHYALSEFPVGSEVTVKVDWQRRFDHMQQHTAQHLITGIADSLFGFKTTSWYLGDPIVSIELDTTSVSKEQLDEIERVVNEKIRAAIPVTPHLYPDKEDPKLSQFRARGLPDDHEGPVRVLEIQDIDTTLCCGTHVANLSHLQLCQSLLKEMAQMEAAVYKLQSQKEPVFCHFRKDADGDYMSILVSNILEVNKDAICFVCVGDEKESGLFTLVGPAQIVADLSPKMQYLTRHDCSVSACRIAEVLEAKGAVSGGRYRGKANKMGNRAKAEKLLREQVSSLLNSSGDSNQGS
ncbi:hypothetical protein C0Q70_02900 [Pomacea canaliculata]|uniref:Alanyl-transfer RNA synthetases family profile domain-containing protein n=1 Tax=Pomacea canaliculata TaxID=400727 RepID=A0A2T7PR80_POMCA|nr:hypothetical protein C0Q70_02900 [Pomacea canaliculata]